MKDKQRIYGPMEDCEEYWLSLPDEFYWASECEEKQVKYLIKWRKRLGAKPAKVAQLAGFELDDYLRIEKLQRKITNREGSRIDDALIEYSRHHISGLYKVRDDIRHWRYRHKRVFSRLSDDEKEMLACLIVWSLILGLELSVLYLTEFSLVGALSDLMDYGLSFAIPVGLTICFAHWMISGKWSED